MERYAAIFECADNGKFTVICRGYYKKDKQNYSIFPTVEEAIEEYSSNALFIGLGE